eukprot:1991109-Pleurochrysis_carterae.AAC.1
MEGSVSQSIVSFVSLLFQALTQHEEPMICQSEPIGNVLLTHWSYYGVFPLGCDAAVAHID